jgi:hypothetical protein
MCRRDVKLDVEVGALKLMLESNCMGTMSKLQNNERDRSMHGPLVEEIKELLRGFDDHVLKHARRSCNGAAHL